MAKNIKRNRKDTNISALYAVPDALRNYIEYKSYRTFALYASGKIAKAAIVKAPVNENRGYRAR